jgi:hypothetical protein
VPSPGFEPTTLWLRVRRPNHSAMTLQRSPCVGMCGIEVILTILYLIHLCRAFIRSRRNSPPIPPLIAGYLQTKTNKIFLKETFFGLLHKCIVLTLSIK